MVRILFVEGNLGSGKSTALHYLREKHSGEAIFLQEPVEHWQNLETIEGQPVNLLNAFYKDIPKYGFCFQTYAFLSRMRLLLESLLEAKMKGYNWVVCERSIFTDREIFLECLHENGSVSDEERAVYHELWDFWISILSSHFAEVPIHFLYLNCHPEKALEHIRVRNREEEASVDMDYLVGLGNKHEEIYGEEGTKTELLFNLVKVLNNSHGEVTLERMTNFKSKEEFLADLDRYWREVNSFDQVPA